MRIKIQQFLFGKNHSWQVVGQNIGREFLRLGHSVDFISTDGFEKRFCPDEFLPFVRQEPSGKYDLQLSYTAPHNFPNYLNKNFGGKRFGIWNYEFRNKPGAKKPLLPGFTKFHHAVDLVLPSSNFSKEVFLDMRFPEEKLTVVHHGINLRDYQNPTPWPLRTNKKYKILLNVAQPHKRKALPQALEAFGKAFNRKDDVCLIAKVFKQNKGNHAFDVDFPQIYKTFKQKFPNHAEVEFVYDYIENIADIYASCDINFSATHAECFWLPGLEAMACGLINVAPRYGGLLDFCKDNNSLLINGSIARCDRSSQYWESNPFAVHFVINTNDAAEKLQKSVSEYDKLKDEFIPNINKEILPNFTWEKVVGQILDLC